MRSSGSTSRARISAVATTRRRTWTAPPRLQRRGRRTDRSSSTFATQEIVSTDVPGAAGYNGSIFPASEGAIDFRSFYCHFSGTSAATAITAGMLSLAMTTGLIPRRDGPRAKSHCSGAAPDRPTTKTRSPTSAGRRSCSRPGEPPPGPTRYCGCWGRWPPWPWRRRQRSGSGPTRSDAGRRAPNGASGGALVVFRDS